MQGDDAADVVKNAVLPHARHDARGHADESADEHAPKHQFKRVRKRGEHLLRYGTPGDQRLAEIAAQGFEQKLSILNEERPVQAHFGPQPRQRLRGGRTAQNGQSRIARGHAHDEKDQAAHHQQRRNDR